MFYIAWYLGLLLVGGIPIALEWWRAGRYIAYLEKRMRK